MTSPRARMRPSPKTPRHAVRAGAGRPGDRAVKVESDEEKAPKKAAKKAPRKQAPKKAAKDE